jgi:3',5'-cyclic AMP phosphodiesterase CpdA
MFNAYMYHGAFEVNHSLLKPGAKTFKGTDGAEHPLPDTPAGVDGIRVGYMEKAGKRFAAVRVFDGKADVVLKNEVLLDPQVHLGRGKRFSAEPVVVQDALILQLLGDAIRKNPEQAKELELMKKRVSPK